MTGIADQASLRSEGNLQLEALYRAHASGAVRLAYLLTGDAALAQDLAQEAFVRVGSKLLGLRSPEQARAYLFKTTLNLCRARGRRLKVERAAAARLHRPETELPPDVAARDALWQALLVLPLRQRSALFLRYYEDLSESQAADAFGCSIGAMKSLVNRGLKELRLQLEGTRDD